MWPNPQDFLCSGDAEESVGKINKSLLLILLYNDF